MLQSLSTLIGQLVVSCSSQWIYEPSYLLFQPTPSRSPRMPESLWKTNFMIFWMCVTPIKQLGYIGLFLEGGKGLIQRIYPRWTLWFDLVYWQKTQTKYRGKSQPIFLFCLPNTLTLTPWFDFTCAFEFTQNQCERKNIFRCDSIPRIGVLESGTQEARHWSDLNYCKKLL